MTTYLQVILPLPLEGTFTYRLPKEMEVRVGARVIVSFGKKKIYTGVVASIDQDSQETDYSAKPILDVLDEDPVVNALQLSFFQWMASYYMCTLGEVLNAALPASLKLSSQSFVAINPEIDVEDVDVSDREWELLRVLQRNDISVKEIGEMLQLKQPQQLLKKLAQKGLIDLYEKIKDKHTSKKIKRVRLNSDLLEGNQLELLLNELESKPKQQDVLLTYLRDVPILEDRSKNVDGIAKSSLISQDVSASSISTLIKRGILEAWDAPVSRFGAISSKDDSVVQLSEAQTESVRQIRTAFGQKSTVLLQGVTGSGKTEVYIELIKSTIKAGEQVLFLLPEIALTTQIVNRLQRVFGASFGVYHSRYSESERTEVWHAVHEQKINFVVGVRSAVFLPFSNLGLVIVDEEHEPSYKQFEPAPRYHARDGAIYLATLHQAKVLLGTATPALETYKNALDEKFGFVELTSRYGEAFEPSLFFANTLKERKQKKLKGNFSSSLVEALTQVLEKKEQAIIFQNRRGYAAYISCDNCATVPKCPNCAVSLTYHQFNNRLVCHYCGYNQAMYSDCLHCGSKELRQIGFGTEELEEELKLLFPAAIIQRMDLDTTRSKYSYHRIIEAFEEGDIDILVGTQMVSKGLDFDRVNLVGIFDTDRMIHFPNFRAQERAYQLITQVSGRAGRKSKEGKVIIQTQDPDQRLLQKIQTRDYRAFYQSEVLEREHFHYPPFSRMINITFKHREKQVSFQAANYYYHEVLKHFKGLRVIGPVEPMIGKIRNLYLHEITLKIPKGGNLTAIKESLKMVRKLLDAMPAFKSVGVVFDVDPA
ncbi:MAG: primosomal protein N' [Bacteroidota bacterium]